MPQLLTVAFFGSVNPGAQNTLVSQRIARPFRLDDIRVHFALNTNKLLELRFFISPEPSAPTTTEPTGFNILDQAGQVPYLVGDDDTKVVPIQAFSKTAPAWLKVHATNNDTFAHTIDALMIILLDPPPEES